MYSLTALKNQKFRPNPMQNPSDCRNAQNKYAFADKIWTAYDE